MTKATLCRRTVTNHRVASVLRYWLIEREWDVGNVQKGRNDKLANRASAKTDTPIANGENG